MHSEDVFQKLRPQMKETLRLIDPHGSIDEHSYEFGLTLEPVDPEMPYWDYIIVEQNEYEGSGDGLTLRLAAVFEGGMMGPICHPFNYTEECWTKSMDDMERRATIIHESIKVLVNHPNWIEETKHPRGIMSFVPLIEPE